MHTKKDKTNVAPIYREQVFIPASGATLMKQKSRLKVAGRPVSSGAIEIVSPEFDLLTGVRGLVNMIKPNRVYANIFLMQKIFKMLLKVVLKKQENMLDILLYKKLLNIIENWLKEYLEKNLKIWVGGKMVLNE